MANIRQYQRRAIESVVSHSVQFCFRPQTTVWLYDSGRNVPIWFLGISRGVGTCSDVLGLNVAVLSATRPPCERDILVVDYEHCLCAVILRAAYVHEYTHVPFIHPSQPLMCVERLDPFCIHESTIQLVCSGERAFYVPL